MTSRAGVAVSVEPRAEALKGRNGRQEARTRTGDGKGSHPSSRKCIKCGRWIAKYKAPPGVNPTWREKDPYCSRKCCEADLNTTGPAAGAFDEGVAAGPKEAQA